jgi:hypothetical protein
MYIYICTQSLQYRCVRRLLYNNVQENVLLSFKISYTEIQMFSQFSVLVFLCHNTSKVRSWDHSLLSTVLPSTVIFMTHHQQSELYISTSYINAPKHCSSFNLDFLKHKLLLNDCVLLCLYNLLLNVRACVRIIMPGWWLNTPGRFKNYGGKWELFLYRQ